MTTTPQKPGWFEAIPAYGLIFFRSAVTATSFLYLIPKMSIAVSLYLSSSFHPRMFSWSPVLPAHTGTLLMLAQNAAALCLFFGLLPRLAAGFLAASGLFVFILDQRHYAHWVQFHLILLMILAVTKLPPITSLFQKKDPAPAQEAWPRYLVLYQLAIVFFYTALDKVFSPFWGLSGTFFLYDFDPAAIVATDLFPGLRRLAYLACLSSPAAASLAVIGTEFFIAFALMIRPLRKAGVLAGFLFSLLLELVVKPSLFAWDAAACFLLLLVGESRKAAAWSTVIFIGLALLRFGKLLWH